MRKQLAGILLAAGVFALSLHSFSFLNPALPVEVVDLVQARYNGISTITAKFRQVSVNKVSLMEEKSWGTVYISKPGKMRWEYEKPERRLIVSDGENVWTYLPEQNQVYVASLNEEHISRTPLMFLLGKGDLKKEFDVVSPSVKKDGKKVSSYRVDLKPHTPQMNLSQLVLEVDAESYLITKSSLYDVMNNLISIKFEQIVIDSHLPDSLFRFSPPENADIINMSGKSSRR